MSKIKWVLTNATKFASIVEKDANAIYFVQDTMELYKGSVSYTKAVEFVTELPASPATGKIYIVSSTLVGSVWTGTEWKVAIPGVASVLVDETTQNGAVSGEAIKTYISGKLTGLAIGTSDLAYESSTKTLTFNEDGTPGSVAITGFLTGASYSGVTSTLTLTQAGGDNIDIVFPADNFVTSGTYNSETKKIVLTLKDSTTVEIPAQDLVPDLSDKLGKVTLDKADEIITANADGTIKTSGIKAGGATLAETPLSTTLASEAAVDAAITAAISWVELLV